MSTSWLPLCATQAILVIQGNPLAWYNLAVAMEDAVLVESLVKRFGSVNAVDGISFNVRRGEIFGILGPNGAGKTTTLEIIEGLQSPTQGSVSVLGLDIGRQVQQVKARIGVQLQSAAYFDYLTLKEILALLGTFYPKSVRPSELLEKVDLADQAKMFLKQLSGGQKQRFTLAASLVNTPELVIFDEPTTGLDPLARRNIWALIRQIHQQDVTIVLTTHYMEEAEENCDRLAIIKHGRLLASGAPRELIARIEASYAVKLAMAAPLTGEQLELLHLNGVEAPSASDGTTYFLRLDGSPAALQDLLDRVAHTGVALEQLEITPVRLEDVFIELTRN
jgi:ABC-2 type transport system ATP-binding protein